MGEQSVAGAKQQLQEELGPEKFRKYLELLREWFGQRLTKQMLDYEVVSLFSEKCFILHNRLLQAVLLQCAAGFAGAESSPASVPGMQGSKLGDNSEGLDSNGDTGELEERNNNDIYIIPPVPGEEPYIYPPDAIDYPVETKEAQTSIVEMMEVEPPEDCDWLQEIKINYHQDDSTTSDISMKNRFPPWFAHDFQRLNTQSYTHEVNVVPNVTHLVLIRDILERRSHLKQHFVPPKDKDTPYLTSGSSLYGRILIKAWHYNIQNVNHLVTEHAVKAVKDNIKNIIVSILKQRRPFRMREKRILHSVGVPCSNPYLLQGYHSYDEAYGSDTTKMADVVMQVPAPFPTLEEKERLSALQVASSYYPKDSRFISAKGTMMDFLCALEENPSLIPDKRKRFKLIDSVRRNCKGFTGSQNSQYSYNFGEEEDDDAILEQTSQPLPLCSY